MVVGKDFIGSDVWASGVRFAGSEVLSLPASDMIVPRNVPPSPGSAGTGRPSRAGRADVLAIDC